MGRVFYHRNPDNSKHSIVQVNLSRNKQIFLFLYISISEAPNYVQNNYIYKYMRLGY